MAKLLAIDGLNIVRRVYEASPEPDSPIKAATALRHALSSFRTVLDTHQPTHVLAAFDYGGTTWRHALYPRYREHRAPMPSDLRAALPEFQQRLTQAGMHPLSIPDVEADDVIGTGVLRWLAEGRGEAIVATTDKDLHGLVAHGALVWDHFANAWHDDAWVRQRFGVAPEQIVDLLALMGDVTDGVPGVSKVGMKTAARLLNAYGDLDAVMAGAGILKTPLGERLRAERDILYLSRQLVELKTDVRLGVTWNMLAYSHTWSPEGSSMLKALIIDASAVARGLLNTVMAEGGYEVVGSVHTMAQGLALAVKFRPQLICIARDQIEDGSGGVEELRAKLPKSLIFMVSGAIDAATIQSSLALGINGFIVKPFKADAVLKTIKTAVLALVRKQQAAQE